LVAIIERGERNVQMLEALLPAGTSFSRDPIPCDGRPPNLRPAERRRWFETMSGCLEHADLLFLDPDNGIAAAGTKPTQRSAGKSVSIAEITALRRPGRNIIIYHHQTRRRGGHVQELSHLAATLEAASLPVAGALRAKPWSPRAFIFIDANPALVARAEAIATAWKGHMTWQPST
jgi:hypothetical protein